MCVLSEMTARVVSAPVSRLSGEAKRILGHLNAHKLFASDGPGGLPRDVRGIATLFGLSDQDTGKLTVQAALELWIQRVPTATVQQLWRYLEVIDRYDVRDDLVELAAGNRLVTEAKPQDLEAYTMDDLVRGAPQTYDALVIFAEEDQTFVDRMFHVMQDIGFKLFKKHGLGPGVMQHGAMSELIDTRCRYTILVFSPEFLRSVDEKFYSQYVHAKQIADSKRHMIPCVYQPCQTFKELRFYTTLHAYKPGFWHKLAINLNYDRNPRLNIPTWVSAVESDNTLTAAPTIRIDESRYITTQVVNNTPCQIAVNRQIASDQPTNMFVNNCQAINGTACQVEANGRIFNVRSSQQANLFTDNDETSYETVYLANSSRQSSTNFNDVVTNGQFNPYRSVVNGQTCSHLSQPAQAFVTNVQAFNGNPYRTDVNRAITHFSKSTNATHGQAFAEASCSAAANKETSTQISQPAQTFVTNVQAFNGTPYRTDVNRAHFSKSTNPLVANSRAFTEASSAAANKETSNQFSQPAQAFITDDQAYRIEVNRQHNNIFANGSSDRPVAEQVPDKSTYTPNDSINRQDTDSTANITMQSAQAEYIATIQLVTDHFSEHPNDQESTLPSQHEYSTSCISSDQSLDGQSSLLTNSTYSLMDNLSRLYRNIHPWVVRNRLFQNRTNIARVPSLE